MGNKLNPLVRIFSVLNYGLILVLACELVLFRLTGVPLQSDPDDLVDRLSTQPLAIRRLSDLSSYQEAIDRSLFSWNRRPKTAIQIVENSDALAARWQLSGLVNTGITTYAIFSEIAGERELRLERGMYLDAWLIESLTHEQVVLTHDDEQEVFWLNETDTVKGNAKTVSK